jgi:hypothetical protein
MHVTRPRLFSREHCSENVFTEVDIDICHRDVCRLIRVIAQQLAPVRNGWSVFEAPGVEPLFLNQKDAISCAMGRSRSHHGSVSI